MNFREQREQQQKAYADSIRTTLQQKLDFLREALPTVDLTHDCQTPLVFFQTQI